MRDVSREFLKTGPMIRIPLERLQELPQAAREALAELEDLDVLAAGARLEAGHQRFVERIREREEAARAAAEGAKP